MKTLFRLTLIHPEVVTATLEFGSELSCHLRWVGLKLKLLVGPCDLRDEWELVWLLDVLHIGCSRRVARNLSCESYFIICLFIY